MPFNNSSQDCLKMWLNCVTAPCTSSKIARAESATLSGTWGLFVPQLQLLNAFCNNNQGGKKKQTTQQNRIKLLSEHHEALTAILTNSVEHEQLRNYFSPGKSLFNKVHSLMCSDEQKHYYHILSCINIRHKLKEKGRNNKFL